MITKAAVDAFLAQKNLAVVGVSRKGGKFGNTIFKELKGKGYRVYPVNPQAETINGERCYASVRDLPQPMDGIVVVVPPAQTEVVVQDAAEAGIERIWIQQGAESEKALRFCEERGLKVIHGECILMFADPKAFHHKLHRWIWGLFGKLPQ